MTSEEVRVWRAPGEDRVLLMAGRTASYAIEPRGEYVFGVVEEQAMRARRGTERRLVRPGEIVAWDPSGAHSGVSAGDGPWRSRLMVLEIASLAAIAGDDEEPVAGADVAFPDPVVRDPALARSFADVHVALESASTRLEGDERLSGWLRTLIDRSSAVRRAPRVTGRDDRAVRAALEYLAVHPERNVSLDELAAAAGVGKFRLVRLVRARTGLAPHALQVAQRIRAARRLLEAGEPIGATAIAVGFADQSHLHRHFQRSLGLTPGDYQRRLTA